MFSLTKTLALAEGLSGNEGSSEAQIECHGKVNLRRRYTLSGLLYRALTCMIGWITDSLAIRSTSHTTFAIAHI